MQAQLVSCPPNLSFEQGNLQQWTCRTGEVSIDGNTNSLAYNWTGGNTQVENRHTVISSNTNEVDLYGNFGIRCPNGAPYVVKLGNSFVERQAESISYIYSIPATTSNFSVIYYYAVVFEDPGHESIEQPRFTARVLDNVTNRPLECVSFDFTAANGLPGFRESTVKQGVLYKGWTPVSLDLSEFAGRTIRIEFTTNDCTRGGHFGYAYVAMDPTCSGNLGGSIMCGDDRSATLQAPFGYASYTWYSGQDYNTVLGTDRLLTLSDPPVGTLVSVRIVPFPGFGCEDTLHTTITRVPRPTADAGPDRLACRNQGILIGTPAANGYKYSWTPTASLSDPQIAMPTAFPSRTGLNQYVLRVVDLATACDALDTVLLTVPEVDTAVVLQGALNYCEGDMLQTTFTASTAVVSVQWYRNDQPIAGAVQHLYRPDASGVYYAVVGQNGCTDTSSRFSFQISERPNADFLSGRNQFCNHTPIEFTNESVWATSNEPGWLWNFSDGQSSQDFAPTLSFTEPGTLNIRLIASLANGCSDTVSKTVALLPRVLPDFEWAAACNNTPVQFNNLSLAAGSRYEWNFGNGESSNQPQPAPIAYPLAGEYRVSLSVVSPGCETEPLVQEQLVKVAAAQQPLRYYKKVILPNEDLYLQARSLGSVYQWQPASLVENAGAAFTKFIGTESAELLVLISEPSGCQVVDTVEVLVLKSDAVWMPTAFSPNGDGLNDMIRPFVSGSNQLVLFSVYNRQGQRVFSSSQPTPGWDGSSLGKPAAPDVYVWMVEYKDGAGQLKLAKGTLTLVR